MTFNTFVIVKSSCWEHYTYSCNYKENEITQPSHVIQCTSHMTDRKTIIVNTHRIDPKEKIPVGKFPTGPNWKFSNMENGTVPTVSYWSQLFATGPTVCNWSNWCTSSWSELAQLFPTCANNPVQPVGPTGFQLRSRIHCTALYRTVCLSRHLENQEVQANVN